MDTEDFSSAYRIQYEQLLQDRQKLDSGLSYFYGLIQLIDDKLDCYALTQLQKQSLLKLREEIDQAARVRDENEFLGGSTV